MISQRQIVSKASRPFAPIKYHLEGSQQDLYAACKEAVPLFALYRDPDLGIWLKKMPVRKPNVNVMDFDEAVFNHINNRRGVVWAGD